MPSTKQPHDDPLTTPTPSPPQPPYTLMFARFRDDIDAHHERRERIIKASREITALSKKIIFSLQRAPALHAPLPASISAETSPRLAAIATLLGSIRPDLALLHAARYARHVAPALQELTEALALAHYLETCAVLSHADAARRCGEAGGVGLGADDFLLGLADLGGELMRYAITGMATGGAVPRARDGGGAGGEEDILADLRALRAGFEGLGFGAVAWRREAERKVDVIRTCVDKVEAAVYGLIVRGRERPKGWVPELGDERRVEDEGGD